MIEAICDKCGKRATLKYDFQGFKKPLHWDIVAESFPPSRNLVYVVVCPDCNPNILKKGRVIE